MREMKDSGVEWIGEIPFDWETKRLKYLVDSVNDRSDNNDNYLGLENVEGWTGRYLPTQNEAFEAEGASIGVCKGDVLFGKLRPYLAKCYIAHEDGCCSTEFIVMRNKEIERKYIWYIMLSPLFIEEVNMSTYGAKMPRASWNFIGNMRFPYPDNNHQKRIVEYLDTKCSKIDAIIARQKEIIEKLKEYKLSVITEAVTKGLNPDAKMQDSGNAWIGEIPESCTITRVGHLYSLILGKMLSSKPESETDTYEEYFCAANVHFEGIDENELKKMWFSEKEKEQYLVKKGDLLVVEGGAGAGGAAIVRECLKPTYIQNSILIVRSDNPYNNKWMYYTLYSLVKRKYIDLVCNKATIPHFTKDKLGNVPIVIFPQEDVKVIVDYLDRKCSNVDKTIQDREEAIEKLKEYKKSLIYEVVTGKKEV